MALWFWSKSQLSSHSTARRASPFILLFCLFLHVKNGGSLEKRKTAFRHYYCLLTASSVAVKPGWVRPGQMAALILCSFVCSRPSDPLCSKHDVQKHWCQEHLSILLLLCLFNFTQKKIMCCMNTGPISCEKHLIL